MMVYQSQKTIITILLKKEQIFTYKFLDSLNTFLGHNVPPMSAQLESVINKVLSKDDPIRFFYYNEMNLAVKFSNLITKEIFTIDLILLLNQVHD